MSYKQTELVEEPFVNSIGQTINPGDKVVPVTTGYGHRVNIITGVFEGVRRRTNSSKGIVGSRIGGVPVKRTRAVYTEDGEHAEMKYDYTARKTVPSGRRYNIITEVTQRKSSLQLNRVFKIDTNLSEVTI
jgi:hypothetical protein